MMQVVLPMGWFIQNDAEIAVPNDEISMIVGEKCEFGGFSGMKSGLNGIFYSNHSLKPTFPVQTRHIDTQ